MKQRLEYIDALRGLAILLVVFMHVPQYGQAGDVGGYYMMLVKMLTVPLFFFISGLFVPLSVTPPISGRKYLKRAHTLLLPTILIGGVYASLYDIPIAELLNDKYKAGYWFTLTLFEYYVIADVVKLMSFRRQMVCDMLLIVMSVACYLVAMPSARRLYADVSLLHIIGIEQWKYFVFFVMGMFVKRYADVVQSDKGGAVIVSAFIAVYIVNAVGDFRFGGLLFHVNWLLQQAMSVLLAYYVFYKYRNTFSSLTVVGKWLSLIGTSTLEIYLLHYFVLPRHLSVLSEALGLSENPLVALFAVALTVIGTVAVVLAVKEVLQCNPYVRKLLWNK